MTCLRRESKVQGKVEASEQQKNSCHLRKGINEEGGKKDNEHKNSGHHMSFSETLKRDMAEQGSFSVFFSPI
ncbi:hypothetical protein EYC80_003131 [Monilinia laxa]|uniref:Uncharacterized protein n=1 Tax=Monilinia laxa TaxID=61186 RepID=A0A5N6KCZ7_MONLA|nr:hypothetical protein EYC80_003131 [Monilinia laxa]